eukprot:GGOE01045171.1.p1 GENE.GGOE01045171.1~~GGOE01045171.1.p1  ORF type:complete len:114 (-),score=3.19 GGOE01045171.1:104-445(-)
MCLPPAVSDVLAYTESEVDKLPADALKFKVNRDWYDRFAIVLVWDSGPGQTDREVLDWCWDNHIQVMVVPGGCTGICQMLDLGLSATKKRKREASKADQGRIKASFSENLGWK